MSWRPVVTVVLFSSVILGQNSTRAPREKVAEGKYLMSRDSHFVQGSDQDWTLWRMPDGGYQVEDHFHIANSAAEMVAAIGSSHVSREIRAGLEHESSEDSLILDANPQFIPSQLTLAGFRLTDYKPIEQANCAIASTSVHCRGADGSARKSFTQNRDFLFSFPFPLLVRGLVLAHPLNPGASQTIQLVVLRVGSKGPSLDESGAELKCFGEDTISLGDRNFRAVKYALSVQSSKEPLNLTFWMAKRAVVLAIEEAGQPGERQVLTSYKDYGDF